MHGTSIASLFSEALASDRGLLVTTSDYTTACRLRRQLYALRDQKRRQGDHNYDQLSFIPKLNGELMIVKRDAMSLSNHSQSYETRVLQQDELPRKIIARGKHGFGLLSKMYIEKLLFDGAN